MASHPTLQQNMGFSPTSSPLLPHFAPPPKTAQKPFPQDIEFQKMNDLYIDFDQGGRKWEEMKESSQSEEISI